MSLQDETLEVGGKVGGMNLGFSGDQEMALALLNVS